MEINLKAHRCPTAQVLMNRILEAFVASDEPELVISTIEPSLHRNTLGRIAGLELPLVVNEVHTRQISDRDLLSWQEQFDEDDFGDVRDGARPTIDDDGDHFKAWWIAGCLSIRGTGRQ